MTNATQTPLCLAGRNLTTTRHVCALYRSRDEQYEMLMPFFREGMERGDKIVHMVDSKRFDTHLSSCRARGIDVDTGRKTGQFEMLGWEDTYLKDGYFDCDRTMTMLEQAIAASRPTYSLVRFLGDMEWVLESSPNLENILEFEARVNHVSPNYPDPFICAYDLNRHSAGVIMDILRTHPLVLVAGLLQENPFYVSPDEFLRELRSRKEVKSASSQSGASK